MDSVNLTLGKSSEVSINVKLAGVGNDIHNTCPELLHFKLNKSSYFENIKPQIVTKLVPYNSKLNLKFEHAQPALLEEWYKIVINIINEENCNLKDIKFELTLIDDVGLENSTFCT